MATKKISELEAITEADDSDVLAIVDVSEGKTNKITKNNLLIGAGHSIEMSLNQETYALTLTLKNAAGTELSRASIDLPNENALTNIEYSNGKLTLTKQSGTTTEVDISGLINGLATETALNNLANALKETIGIQTNTYDNTKTYNTGDIVVQNEKIYKANQDNITGTFDSSKWDEISLYEYQKIQDEAIEENYKVITKLQEDVEDLTERMEDAENNEMTYTPEIATSHYLQDSADSRFRKFIPIARTTQESTTGASKFDLEELMKIGTSTNYSKYDNGYTFNTINAMFNAGITLDTPITLPVSFSYKIKNGTGTNFRLKFWFDNGTSISLDNYGSGKETTEVAISANNITKSGATSITKIGADWSNSGAFSIRDFIINEGSTATAYEPYTGGEPAPNPNYPYAIKNTGDNGSVNEKIQNENLFDYENYTYDKTIFSDYRFIEIKNVKSNTNYTIYNYNKALTGFDNVFFADDAKYRSIKFGTQMKNVNSRQVTTNAVGKLCLCAYATSWNETLWNTFIKNFENAMFVEGTDISTPYVPHAEQNLSFPLAEGQKFYEGSHPDDDEKVHHKRGEMLFDGSSDENWIYNPTYAYFYITTSGFKSADFCDHYSKETSETLTNNHFRFNPNNGNLYIKDERFTSASSFKTWLATNNIILQGELAEEQTEDFTEEQKTAWKEWQKAKTYKNITHISSEDETPANVEIEYVQDNRTLYEDLKNAIISLGGNV